MNLVSNLVTNFSSLAASIENIGALATVLGTLVPCRIVWFTSFGVFSPCRLKQHYNQPCKKRYIAKGTLTRAVSSPTPHTRNSSYSTSCSPRFSRCLMTSIFAYSIWLTPIFGHICVDKADHIRPDLSCKHSWESCLPSFFSCLIKDWYKRSCSLKSKIQDQWLPHAFANRLLEVNNNL